jgi:hypothetical protein
MLGNQYAPLRAVLAAALKFILLLTPVVEATVAAGIAALHDSIARDMGPRCF